MIDDRARTFVEDVATQSIAAELAERRMSGALEYDAKNWARALVLLEPVALAGCADVATMIGTIYQLGLGCGVSVAEARRWYERAAGQGMRLRLGIWVSCSRLWEIRKRRFG